MKNAFYLHSLWHKTLARKITNNFWKSTLLSWAKVIDSTLKDQNIKVLNSPLWYNPTISDVPLFYQDWYNKGIILKWTSGLLSTVVSIMNPII